MSTISAPMPNLQSRLQEIAQNFASAVLDALKGAPLQELLGGGRAVGNGRSALRAGGSAAAKHARSSGRLPRRSAEDIGKALEQVVSLVKKHGDGLRAEQIRDELGLQPKEMPRILKEGLSTKKLKSKGQKRATTYFVR
ncbi:MAG TPA: hypothetical protein VNZ26_09730 [Vicinamibacterales bacterium]|jgi:hypothetical protein|nr:hypothetical protein [Vicinamibacterales bacterium]